MSTSTKLKKVAVLLMPNTAEPFTATERVTLEKTNGISHQWMGSARQWLVSSGRRVDAEIRRHEYLVLAGALAVVTLFASVIAWRLPFDVDEYLVQKTALAGSPSAIWHLLKTAPLSVDPPLFHFLTYYSLRIFGAGESVIRLPSVVAYTLMTFFLYRFIRRYADVYTGFVVVALCLLCGAFPFAYDARPYALWLGASAMALSCWASLVEERPGRALALAGLFLGIAVAIGSHWLGFLVLVPFVAGEAVRTWQTRQVDAGRWIVLFAAAATALAYVPLLKAASEYRSLPWKGVALGDISASFQLVLEPCLVPLAMSLVIFASARLIFGKPSVYPQRPSMPAPIFICVVVFALAPFSVFLFGKLVTHAFQPRYALLCTIGLLVLLALTIRDAVGRRPLWMASAVLILGGYASIIQVHSFLGLPSRGDPLTFADISAFSADPSIPIVPGGNGLFLRMESHAPTSLRGRCVFPTDPDMIRLLHQNTNFLMTEGIRRWTNLPIIDLTTFLRAHPRFYVIQLACCPSWLIDRLMEDHANISLQGTYDGNPVYLVDVRH